MKLAVVRQRYNPYGGAERFVSRALSALRDSATVDLTLITRHWDEQNAWRTLRIDPFYITRTGRDRGFARAAARCFPQFDLVQSHERIPGTAIFRAGDGVHSSWLEQLGRVQTSTRRWLTRSSRYHRYVVAAEEAMFDHRALRCVICNSHMVAADIVRRFGLPAQKLAVVYNGVDPVLYNPELKRHRASWRSQHQIPEDAPLLAYIGSGFVRKGVATALAAIAKVAPVRLVIAGDDKHIDRFQALAARLGVAERVLFLGPVPNVRPLYGAADALILPSLYDPFPNVCVEALSSGLPLFTSPTCGAAEWVSEGENGWVVDALDVSGYRHALGQWLDRRSEWPQMRETARSSAESHTLERMVAELEALYSGLLDA